MHSNSKKAPYALITALQAITAQTRLNDFLATVVHEIKQITDATRVFVLLNDERDAWHVADSEHPSVTFGSLEVVLAERLISETLVHQCLQAKCIVNIHDLTIDSDFTNNAYFNDRRQGSFIAFPVIAKDIIIALLLLDNEQFTSAFSLICVENLQIFTTQMAFCLQHIQRYAALDLRFTQYVQATTQSGSHTANPDREHLNNYQKILDILQIPGTSPDNKDRTNTLTIPEYQTILARSECIFRLIADNAPFAIFLLNQKNQTLYINRKFTELLGYQLDDIPSLVEWRRQVLPDVELAIDNRFNLTHNQNDAFLENAELASQEFLVTCKDGFQKTLNITFVLADIYKAIICTEFTTRRQQDLDYCSTKSNFQVIFEKAHVGIALSDSRGFLLNVNDRFAEMLDCSPEYMVGKNSGVFCHPDDKPSVIELYHRFMKGELNEYRIEMRWVRLTGEFFWADSFLTLLRDSEGNPEYFFGIHVDITERKKTEIALVASEQRFRQLFNKSPLPLALLKPKGHISLLNTRFIESFGYSTYDMPTINAWWTCAFPNIEARRIAMELWTQAVKEARKKCTDIKPTEFLVTCRNGQTRTIIISGVAVGEDLLMMFMDITEQKQYQNKLEHIAHFDALTNLPNRVLLADRLTQSMNRARRQNQSLAVVYLDLDGFKAINDNYGHEAGDHLLQIVATRMKFALREIDTIARLGGDEFVAVISDVKDMNPFTPLVHRLLDAAKQPIIRGDQVLQVSASLGITFYPQAEEIDADQLLRQADQAMYQAKLMGKNRFIIFDSELDRSIRGLNEGIEQIRLGFTENEFILHYQPKVNLTTGAVIGVEALLRWQHPTEGLKFPEQFLPIIEKNILIIGIGEWVIEQALCQIEIWQALGLSINISVNIAALHLQQMDFVERLRQILSNHPQVNPGLLELEVLESCAIEDMERAYSVIHGCLKLGIGFALDDFGTGYSSLSYLKRLPIKVLKIDKCFVRDMLNNPEDLAILAGVISLASASRRQVIAEGVESLEHGEMLLQIGCVNAQGYGIAQPMLAQALPAWMQTWRPNTEWLNCPTLGHEELILLSAIVEHRAWVKSVEDFFHNPLALPPPFKNTDELANWLQKSVNHYHDKFEEFNTIQLLNTQLLTLATELLMNYKREELVEFNDTQKTTFFTLSQLMDKKLRIFLKSLQKIKAVY